MGAAQGISEGDDAAPILFGDISEGAVTEERETADRGFAEFGDNVGADWGEVGEVAGNWLVGVTDKREIVRHGRKWDKYCH